MKNFRTGTMGRGGARSLPPEAFSDTIAQNVPDPVCEKENSIYTIWILLFFVLVSTDLAELVNKWKKYLLQICNFSPTDDRKHDGWLLHTCNFFAKKCPIFMASATKTGRWQHFFSSVLQNACCISATKRRQKIVPKGSEGAKRHRILGSCTCS